MRVPNSLLSTTPLLVDSRPKATDHRGIRQRMADLPGYYSLPLWHFERSAAMEIIEYWNDIPQEERERILLMQLPIPSSMIIETWIGDMPFACLVAKVGSRYYEAWKRKARPFAVNKPLEDYAWDNAKDFCLVVTDTYEDVAELFEQNSDLEPDPDRMLMVLEKVAFTNYAVRAEFADRYVNKERRASGLGHKPLMIGGKPRPGNSVITVKWDAPTPRYVEPEHPIERTSIGPTGPRCEHDVKEHLRQLKSGKVVYVRPHKRGDPAVPRKTTLRII